MKTRLGKEMVELADRLEVKDGHELREYSKEFEEVVRDYFNHSATVFDFSRVWEKSKECYNKYRR